MLHSPDSRTQRVVFCGFDDAGDIWVLGADGVRRCAETMLPLSDDDVGITFVAIELGESPVLIGRLLTGEARRTPVDVRIDGKTVMLKGEDKLELRCGSARICLTADGKVTVEGMRVVQRAQLVHRLQGAAVQVN